MSIAELVAREGAVADDCAPTAVDVPSAVGQATDEELLRRFVSERNEIAFGALVTRHASLVMGVCRRALGNEQDAEDAFQATFLVLARRAASVRRSASLAAWLYKTAYRLALRARAQRARRKALPLEAEAMIAPEALSQIASQHDQSMLDEELNRLPDKYRLPLFLCCVEGMSRDEAATQLGLSAGAVKGQLERGRQLLRRRLMLRGVSLSVAVGLMLGLEQTTQAAHTVTPSLITATAEAGSRYAVGKSAAGIVSQNALTLANGSCHIMSLTATKLVVSFLFILGALTVVGNSLPAPAVAGGTETVVLPAQLANAVDSEYTLVYFQGDQEGERRSVEREGQRRSAEAEAGRRRSPEAAAGPRRSPEAEAGPRRSAEAEAQRDSNDGLRGFKPQSEREATLYRMILQLQREVADLRRAVGQPSAGRRDRDRQVSRRDGHDPALTAGWENTKAGGVFQAYDKNGDQFVVLDEWLAMTNGNVSAVRKELQTKRFHETKPGDDKKLSPAEFIRWWNNREGAAPRDREGGRSAEGSRDAEASPRLNADERKQQKIFQSRDKNQDRKLSRTEFDSLFEGGDTSRLFAAADRNLDGSLSLEEFVEYRLRRRPTAEGDQPSNSSREGDRDR